MSLLNEWQNSYENKSEEEISKFWTEYTSTEKRIYEIVLADYPNNYKGIVSELAAAANADEVIFMGFIDGISESLNNEIDLESIERDTEIDLDIDYEKLYFNMLKAKAEYLYTLPKWEEIFTQEKLDEIKKAYKISGTVVKGKKIGRNDLCPCGSGKKYKKCCGKNIVE